MLGAAPFRQQIMQITGVFVAAFVMSPILNLLNNNVEGGIGGRELSAPQASLFASLAKGFSGETELPWDMIAMGVVIGFIILIIDQVLVARGAKFRAHLMPIAVGMYLPFGLATPMVIGGLIAYFHSRGGADAEIERRLHKGVLFSSGVIAGEALMSVGLACLTALGVQSLDLGLSPSLVLAFSLIVAVGLVISFTRLTKPKLD
jgi:putative OPT family oligopeptide transporter